MDASLSTVMRMMYTHWLTYKAKFFGQSVFWRYWQNRHCPGPKIYGACLRNISKEFSFMQGLDMMLIRNAVFVNFTDY